MKYFVFILLFCNSIGFSQAQNCEDNFIKNIEQTYKKHKSKYERITSKCLSRSSQLKSISFDDYGTISIPLIVGKEVNGVKVNKVNFFCHLNVKEMEFDEAVIFKDTIVFGIVTQCPEAYCKYKFVNDDSPHVDLFIKPLVKRLLEIKPDIIFSIYHISDAYWYIKGDELKVLAFETDNSKFTDFKIYEAEEYIHSLSDEQISSFLYFKKTKAISN